MHRTFRMQYLKRIWEPYRKARRAEKGRMLDEFCRVCGYHRKHAIALLNRDPGNVERRGRRGGGRPRRYGSEALDALRQVWEAAGYPWSVRLKALLPLWMPALRRRFPLTPDIEKQLLTMSARTMDVRLAACKKTLQRRLCGRTKPGALLKHHIPLRTDRWNVSEPGWTEIDLVSHGGGSERGEFLHSLNVTDIATGWTETRAVMGKSELRVQQALEDIRQNLPFPLLGIDSDNGSEFINAHLWRYCQAASIQFTRGRPYKKDDNAHVEQKNWTHVRRLAGWDRCASTEALLTMNDLYRNEWRLFMNLFQPSVRCEAVVRKGSSMRRLFDAPKTPLDRLPKGQKRRELEEMRKRLDPFTLAETIERKLKKLWRLRETARPFPQQEKGAAHG